MLSSCSLITACRYFIFRNAKETELHVLPPVFSNLLCHSWGLFSPAFSEFICNSALSAHSERTTSRWNRSSSAQGECPYRPQSHCWYWRTPTRKKRGDPGCQGTGPGSRLYRYP